MFWLQPHPWPMARILWYLFYWWSLLLLISCTEFVFSHIHTALCADISESCPSVTSCILSWNRRCHEKDGCMWLATSAHHKTHPAYSVTNDIRPQGACRCIEAGKAESYFHWFQHLKFLHLSLPHLLQVYGHKDADGFYRGECAGRVGYIPCNMVSEVQVDSEASRKQLLQEGHIPASMLVESLGDLWLPLPALDRVYIKKMCSALIPTLPQNLRKAVT